MAAGQLHVFGIRHHGPGSARSLLAALEDLRPDAVLIEGPPEGDEMLGFVRHAEMIPPVALLAYVPDAPHRAVFYPYAEFSPEWQALRFGLERDIPVRFIDLPQRHWLAMTKKEPEAAELVAAEEPSGDQPVVEVAEPLAFSDPLDALALTAGFADGERWWEYLVEERPHDAGGGASEIFAAVMEMMSALRFSPDGQTLLSARWRNDPIGPVREASMRQAIRAAQREGFERIAVVCGAWHAPALDLGGSAGRSLPSAKEDAALLKGLAKVTVKVTWVAWGYEQLARLSGYGAGAASPGWYEHLWQSRNEPQQATVRWLARVAQLLREQDLDASAAQVVDATRLADALAAVRGKSRPGLEELNEATLAVFCFGNPLPMQVIGRELIVGNRLGLVPEDVPMLPLYQDLISAEKRLRFPRQMSPKQYDLDLRQPADLDRSRLLHCLLLLDIPWGIPEGVRGAKGTFHEVWTVQWRPDFTVTVIDRAIWGNTIVQAATSYAKHQAATAADLAALTALLDRALLADLDDAAAEVVRLIQEKSAFSGDIGRLMDALPALARTLRYGSVRQDAAAAGARVTTGVDPALIASILDGMVTRICIGLPLACSSLDDEATARMLERLEGVHGSLNTAALPEMTQHWYGVLAQLADQSGLHGLLAGRCCRLLFERGAFGAEEIGRRLSLALSRGNDPTLGAAWLEGLLRGSGLLLLHQDILWSVLDQWVTGISPDEFASVLPLLRRTFAAFPAPERRQMGQRVRRGEVHAGAGAAELSGVDPDRADAVLPLVARLLGIASD